MIYKNYKGPAYYKFLIHKNKLFNSDSQIIGNSILDYSTVGNSVFSPDGRKFVRISNLDGLQIFDFDRCEGVLSNFLEIKNDSFRLSENSLNVNVAISANSRFLYASTSTKIYQYDLFASNIQASEVIIGEWDGFIYKNNYTTKFCDLQLAYDGKIYASCASGNIYLHVIEKPNLKGKDSDFKLRGITLPTNIACGLGNYPNYLLGAEKGSVCDSLTFANNYYSEKPFLIYPNPSDGRIKIENYSSNHFNTLDIHIFDISGNIIAKKALDTSSREWKINIDYLDPGLYFIEFNLDRKLVQTIKWVLY